MNSKSNIQYINILLSNECVNIPKGQWFILLRRFIICDPTKTLSVLLSSLVTRDCIQEC